MTVNDSARILKLANSCIDPDALVETLWELLQLQVTTIKALGVIAEGRQEQPGRGDQDDSGHRQVPGGAVRDCSGPIGQSTQPKKAGSSSWRYPWRSETSPSNWARYWKE